MEDTPLIDVAESDRITELLNAPDTFTFEAFAAETLDGLVPDIGLTGKYPHRSVYRPPSLTNAGVPASLSHRFWGTSDGRASHTGRRWIGVLMYDEHGRDCSLEVRLGADHIGRIVPQRHDNRRHLYVLDRPADFMGGMEVFNLLGTGDASYRLETIALLAARPEPTRYAPQVARATARLRRRQSGKVEVVVDFITQPATRCSVELVRVADGTSVGRAADEEYHSLHTHTLHTTRDEAATDHIVRIVAAELGGEGAEVEVPVTGQSQGDRAGAGSGTVVTVPVQVSNLSSRSLSTVPATFGVPVPRGSVVGPTTGTWQIEDASVTVQCRPHGFWPDGSANWVLVDGPLPQPLEAASAGAQPRAGTVTLMPAGAAKDAATADAADADAVTSQQDDGAVSLANGRFRLSVRAGATDPLPTVEVRADDGAWRAAHRASSARVTLGTGLELSQGPVEDVLLEESGPRRAVVRYRFGHVDAAGVAHLRSTVRVHIYGGLSALRIVHRLEVVSPHLPPTAGGTGADIPADARTVREAVAGEDGERATLLTLRSAELCLDRGPHTEASWSAGSQPVSPSSGLRLVHEHDQGHRVETDTVELADGRIPGRVSVTDADGSCINLGLRDFWQTYPRGIRVAEDSIAIEILPALSGDERPGDEEAWQSIYFWLDADRYLLKAGLALTSELLLTYGERDEQLFDWFADPPAVRPTLSWLNESGVMSPLAPKNTGLAENYEREMEGGYDQWIEDREIWRSYGLINYGDWYGESGYSWGNNEYDPAFAHYCEFLRGGDPRWFRIAGEAARHLGDVDTINFSTDALQVGGQYMHIAGHAGGYLPPYFRSKMRGSITIPSHTWVEGMVLHYLLTGDENQRESLDRTAQWLLRSGLSDFAGGIDYYDFSNCRECGWHLTHLTALARMSESPRSLNAAALIVDRVLERQEPGGGWERLLSESHCGCPPPRERGEAGFMVGVLLSGLRRYHELTGDERVVAAIVGGARWLVARTYDRASGHFRYTPCLIRGGGPSPGQTKQVIEGLAYAFALSGDAELGEVLERGLGDVGGLPSASKEAPSSGFGKAWTSEARYVPTLLAYVARARDR